MDYSGIHYDKQVLKIAEVGADNSSKKGYLLRVKLKGIIEKRKGTKGE